MGRIKRSKYYTLDESSSESDDQVRKSSIALISSDSSSEEEEHNKKRHLKDRKRKIFKQGKNKRYVQKRYNIVESESESSDVKESLNGYKKNNSGSGNECNESVSNTHVCKGEENSLYSLMKTYDSAASSDSESTNKMADKDQAGTEPEVIVIDDSENELGTAEKISVSSECTPVVCETGDVHPPDKKKLNVNVETRKNDVIAENVKRRLTFVDVANSAVCQSNIQGKGKTSEEDQVITKACEPNIEKIVKKCEELSNKLDAITCEVATIVRMQRRNKAEEYKSLWQKKMHLQRKLSEINKLLNLQYGQEVNPGGLQLSCSCCGCGNINVEFPKDMKNKMKNKAGGNVLKNAECKSGQVLIVKDSVKEPQNSKIILASDAVAEKLKEIGTTSIGKRNSGHSGAANIAPLATSTSTSGKEKGTTGSVSLSDKEKETTACTSSANKEKGKIEDSSNAAETTGEVAAGNVLGEQQNVRSDNCTTKKLVVVNDIDSLKKRVEYLNRKSSVELPHKGVRGNSHNMCTRGVKSKYPVGINATDTGKNIKEKDKKEISDQPRKRGRKPKPKNLEVIGKVTRSSGVLKSGEGSNVANVAKKKTRRNAPLDEESKILLDLEKAVLGKNPDLKCYFKKK